MLRLLLRLWTLNLGLWTEALPFLSADTGPPCRTALQFCPPQPVPPPAQSSPFLPALLPHTPRRAGRESTAGTALSLGAAWWPYPAVSLGSLLLPAPAWP